MNYLKDTGVPLRHLRVLDALAKADGPLSRSDLAELIGMSVTATMNATGYSNPQKRAIAECASYVGGSIDKPSYSLLTLNYVREEKMGGCGGSETVVYITPQGRQFLKSLGEINLPSVRSRKSKGERSEDE